MPHSPYNLEGPNLGWAWSEKDQLAQYSLATNFQQTPWEKKVNGEKKLRKRLLQINKRGHEN